MRHIYWGGGQDLYGIFIQSSLEKDKVQNQIQIIKIQSESQEIINQPVSLSIDWDQPKIQNPHNDFHSKCFFSKNGEKVSYLNMMKDDYSIQLFSLDQMKSICKQSLELKLNGTYSIQSINACFSLSGNSLAFYVDLIDAKTNVSPKFSYISLWDYKSYQDLEDFKLEERKLYHKSAITSLSWFRENDTYLYLLATGSEDGIVMIWDAKSGTKLDQLEDPRNKGISISSLKWSQVGSQMLAVAYKYGTIIIWEKSENIYIITKQFKDRCSFYQLDWSTDNTFIIVGTDKENEIIQFWFLETGKKVALPNNNNYNNQLCVTSVALSQNNDFAFSQKDGKMEIFSLGQSQEGQQQLQINRYIIGTIEQREYKQQNPPLAQRNNVCFSFDGNYLAGVQESEKIVIWSKKYANQHDQNRGRITFKHEFESDQSLSMIWALDMSKAFKFVAYGCVDGTIQIWDWEQKKLFKSMNIHESGISNLKFSPDGQYLASSSWDGNVIVWNIENIQREKESQTGCRYVEESNQHTLDSVIWEQVNQNELWINVQIADKRSMYKFKQEFITNIIKERGELSLKGALFDQSKGLTISSKILIDEKGGTFAYQKQFQNKSNIMQ